MRLPNDPYLQPNGYKPAPLDLSAIELTSKMEELVDRLAENTHNVWARERISQGWTYGLNEDSEKRRSPHLVSYKDVDEVKKYVVILTKKVVLWGFFMSEMCEKIQNSTFFVKISVYV